MYMCVCVCVFVSQLSLTNLFFDLHKQRVPQSRSNQVLQLSCLSGREQTLRGRERWREVERGSEEVLLPRQTRQCTYCSPLLGEVTQYIIQTKERVNTSSLALDHSELYQTE